MTLQCGLAVGLRLCPEISGLSSKSQETYPSKFVTKMWEPLGSGQVREFTVRLCPIEIVVLRTS